MKLNCEVNFHWQVTFLAEQILLSESKFEQSLRIKNTEKAQSYREIHPTCNK